MLRSPPMTRPYRRNIRREPTRPASASESVAAVKLAPRGIITRLGVPCGVGPHAASRPAPARATYAPARTNLTSIRDVERMLEEYRCRECIHFTLAAACGLSELAHRPQCS